MGQCRNRDSEDDRKGKNKSCDLWVSKKIITYMFFRTWLYLQYYLQSQLARSGYQLAIQCGTIEHSESRFQIPITSSRTDSI